MRRIGLFLNDKDLSFHGGADAEAPLNSCGRVEVSSCGRVKSLSLLDSEDPNQEDPNQKEDPDNVFYNKFVISTASSTVIDTLYAISNYRDSRRTYFASDVTVAQLAIASARFQTKFKTPIQPQDILDWLPPVPPRLIFRCEIENETTNQFIAKMNPRFGPQARPVDSFRWQEMNREQRIESLTETPNGRSTARFVYEYDLLNRHLRHTRGQPRRVTGVHIAQGFARTKELCFVVRWRGSIHPPVVGTQIRL